MNCVALLEFLKLRKVSRIITREGWEAYLNISLGRVTKVTMEGFWKLLDESCSYIV